jgi:anti-sigma regulatory factor (Ser/Thr protein kinase)
MTESSSDVPIGAMTAGPVQLVVPAEPALSRVVRLAAGGLASLTGFTLDEMEDIKIAVSEVMVALVEHGNGSPVSLDFAARDSGFVVQGRTQVEAFDPQDPDFELSGLVLDEVCSEHGMRFADGHAEIWATVARTV